jgi:thiol-disulfide isomerase/thioredoxin
VRVGALFCILKRDFVYFLSVQMMPRSIRWSVILLLMSSLVTWEITAFCPCPPVRNTAWSSTTTVTIGPPRVTKTLQHVATPFEELEKEEEINQQAEQDDDWTPVAGGFLPRLGRSRNQQQLQRPLITEVSSLEDYKREVIDCDEEVVVVKFYSTWCRSCKDMAPLFKKLANSVSDNTKVKFVQVAVTKHNAVLHQGLGIPSVPYGHIYHKNGGLVEEQKINRKEFDAFKDIFQQYVEGSCDSKMLNA